MLILLHRRGDPASSITNINERDETSVVKDVVTEARLLMTTCPSTQHTRYHTTRNSDTF